MKEQAARVDVETRSQALGSRIRAERRVAGLTVRGLAGRTGLSPSLISQVERGRATPSVATLWAIATELGLSVADLFNGEPEGAEEGPVGVPNGRRRPGAPPIQPHESRKAITLEGGVRWERLTSSSDDEVDFVLVRHGGREFGYVLSGTLGVRIGFDEYEVRENDSISFDSSMPHRLWAIGDEPVRAIWMVINRRADPRGNRFS